MARPTKLTERVQEDICAALMIGATHEIAAGYAGIAIDTFYYWKREGEKVRERLQKEAKKAEAAEIAGEKYKPNYKTTRRETRLLKFLQAVTEANDSAAITHLNFLHQAAPTDPRISQWILERRFPDGFGPPSRKVEHTGRDRGPIQTEDVSQLSPDERIARVLAILNREGSDDAAEPPGD